MNESNGSTPIPPVTTIVTVVGEVASYATEDGETALALRAIVVNPENGQAAEAVIILSPDWTAAVRKAGKEVNRNEFVTDDGEKSKSDQRLLQELLDAGILVHKDEIDSEEEQA